MQTFDQKCLTKFPSDPHIFAWCAMSPVIFAHEEQFLFSPDRIYCTYCTNQDQIQSVNFMTWKLCNVHHPFNNTFCKLVVDLKFFGFRAQTQLISTQSINFTYIVYLLKDLNQ